MRKLYKMLMFSFSLLFLSSCSIALPSNSTKGLPGEVISSIIVVLIGCILFLIIGLKAKKTDPLKRPKGIMVLAEWAVEKIDGMVESNMGARLMGFAPYIMVIFYYIFACFVIGLLGLPSPMTNLIVPLSISLVTFVMIHAVSAYYTRWKYFKRYIDPIPVLLPINLLSMWSPLLSLSFRLFGNGLAGWVIMTIVYGALEGLSTLLFGSIYWLAPIITPVLHAYFDIFSGFIQTLVFSMLTMLFIAQEVPEETLDDSGMLMSKSVK
ncbi:MAG: F0F1 ATP synthase subunit A [Bacilli bacterium]|nr:F0F1 ATP synthase subunit A [Bacilli bacterium]